MTTDSPRVVRNPAPPATLSDSTGTATTTSSTSHSTIESFGTSRPVAASPIYDILTGGETESRRSINTRNRGGLLDDMEKRTIYGSKRRRLEREAKLTARASEPLPDDHCKGPPSPINSDKGSADLLWKSIWGRWDQGPSQHTPSPQATIPSRREQQQQHPRDETRADAEDGLSLSQKSHLSTQSEDGHFQSQFSFYHFEPESGKSNGSTNEDTFEQRTPAPAPEIDDTSRSRIDINLLTASSSESLEDVEIEAEVEGDVLGPDIQDRIDILCEDPGSGMRSVKHYIFRGKAVQAHFGPAWDGFQPRRRPPSRALVTHWGRDLREEGDLYDYGDDLGSVTHWQDQ
ncbi:hypothetical protein CBS101457_001311 [Exobasidium rhododendri]|nr:hypothetical protein CBS101457_001311 [Exobasidium rhododendri]